MKLSKDDALKQLREKWSVIARTGDVGYRHDCPLCDFTGKSDFVNADCELCFDIFGELLGFDGENDNHCYGATYGDIEYSKIWDYLATKEEIKRFAHALCKHLENLEKKEIKNAEQE